MNWNKKISKGLTAAGIIAAFLLLVFWVGGRAVNGFRFIPEEYGVKKKISRGLFSSTAKLVSVGEAGPETVYISEYRLHHTPFSALIGNFSKAEISGAVLNSRVLLGLFGGRAGSYVVRDSKLKLSSGSVMRNYSVRLDTQSGTGSIQMDGVVFRLAGLCYNAATGILTGSFGTENLNLISLPYFTEAVCLTGIYNRGLLSCNGTFVLNTKSHRFEKLEMTGSVRNFTFGVIQSGKLDFHFFKGRENGRLLLHNLAFSFDPAPRDWEIRFERKKEDWAGTLTDKQNGEGTRYRFRLRSEQEKEQLQITSSEPNAWFSNLEAVCLRKGNRLKYFSAFRNMKFRYAGMPVKLETLNLKGEFSNNICSGEISGKIASADFRAIGYAPENLEFRIPFLENGTTAGIVSGIGTKAGLSLAIDNDFNRIRLILSGSATAASRKNMRIGFQVTVDSEGSRWKLDLPESTIPEGLPFLPKNYRITGTVGEKSVYRFSNRGLLSAHTVLEMKNLFLENAKKTLRVQNGSLRLEKSSTGIADVQFSAGRIELAGIPLDNTAATLHSSKKNVWQIREFKASGAGGTLSAAPETIDLNAPRLKIPLEARDITLHALLRGFGKNSTSVCKLSGRIPFFLSQNSGIEFTDAVLTDIPEVPETLEIKFGQENQTVNEEFIRQVLEKVRYDWLSVNLSAGNGLLRMNLRLYGKPEQSLYYRMENGKVERSASRFHFPAIPVSVEFSKNIVPLTKVLLELKGALK